MNDHPTFLNANVDLRSDRLNDDVVLFMGCTLNEILVVVLISLSIALTVSMPIMLAIFGRFTLGLALGLVFFVPILLALLSKLSRLKRGKPSGYYQQFLKIQLSKTGVIRSPYLMRSGKWSTQRVVK